MTRRLLLAAAVTLYASAAAAQDASSGPDVHGFVSPGAVKSTANNFLATSHRGSVQLTEAAVNVTQTLSPTLRMGMQLFSSQVGGQGGFTPRFDWYYLDWHRYDWLSLRAGRVKVPFGFFNEQADYDPGRLTVLLPQSVYPLTSRDELLAATGANLYGRRGLGPAGALEYTAVAGTIFVPVPAGSPEDLRIDVPWMADGRVTWETPLRGLRLAGSVLGTQLVADETLPKTTGPTHIDLHALLWLASVDYVRGPLELSAEYGHWNIRFTDEPRNVPTPPGTVISERYYAAGAWRFNDALEGGLYYAGYFPNVDKREGAGNFQHDVAASLRWDITLNWLVKLEAHYLHGTAYLQPALNGGRPASDLTQDWGLFLVRTTAYF